MGGFASSFETAASSGANSTFSGVPVGNGVGGDGSGFAPASSFSTSSALPETGGGNFGGDWTGQAFAPSAMTPPLAEPGLPETSDWKPQPVPETPSPKLLEKFAPKPATGSGLPVETPLLAKTSEREALRKVNPILSKLAREHPENPVHLKGGLLGALPTQQQPVKPPNPFAQKDELPKLPKIDWGAYDKHRIDGQTRISHDDWARIITGAKDFGGIMPTMVRTAQDGGDGGKANVADVLWRVAQKNPDHARFFQRELSTALGGETIPIRQALMHGEVSPAQLVDPAKSPGLLGTAKPNRFADPDFEKSYWQSAEAYKAEFAQRQQTPPATEEPRQIDPGRRGAISTNPENPATPDRGNFADKLWERQSESQDRQVPDLSADQKATRDTLLKVRTQGKNLGYENSSRMLDHYLNGNGDPVTLDKDLVRQHPPVQDGEAKSQKHFEDWLVGKGPDDNSFGKIWDHLPKGDGTVTIKGMQWDGAVDNPSWRELDDKSNTLGALTVKGEGDLKLERKGNDVFVTGTVNQHAEDKYDFGKNGRDNEWLPQGILGGDFTMTRQQITDMEMAGGAKAFEINTDRWTKVLEGRLKLDDQGNIIGSQFVWKEVPSSDKMRR